MAFIITLEDELGVELASIEDQGHLEELLKTVADKSLICLRFVDPFGLAIFNRLQMPFLINELSLLLTKAQGTPLGDVIAAIVQLAKRCKAEKNTYVYFYGDSIE